MKLFRIIGRDIRDSFKSIFRNFSLSLASISCITITLIVVAISIILSVNVDSLTNKIKKDVTIVAFLDVDITEERIEEIKDEIRKLENIQLDSKGITLNSKMSIRDEMMEASPTYESVMKNWKTREENPLQDAYHIKVIDIDNIEATAKQISKIEGVDVVKYGEGMVERLVSIFEVIRNGSYGVVIALVIVSAFLISNTIKITIFSRKKEIDIMRLVGASNINIKVPFILEGLFIGALGSIIPIIFTTYGYSALYNRFDGNLFGSIITLVKPEPFIYQASLVLFVIGILVGMFGSWRAVRKHLKI
jgi:Cell division protein